MLIGIGSEDEFPTLYASGAEIAVTPSEIGRMIEFRAYRSGDTILLLRPKALSATRYRDLHKVSEGGGFFQVIGHDAVALTDQSAIDAFLALRAKVNRSAPVQEPVGRKVAIPYTIEEAEAILREYYSPKSLADVQAFAEMMLRQEPGTIKPHWVKMLARKYTGNAKRTPPEGWDGIMLDADGRPVHGGLEDKG